MKFVLTNLALPIDHNEEDLLVAIAKESGLTPSEFSYKIIRRSIDARKGDVHFVYSILIESPLFLSRRNIKKYEEPEHVIISKSHLSSRPVIVGFGPAGMFCGLILARAGARPIILERGKCVEERAKDVEALKKQGVLNPESNVCYGEGGAGTFSDGKLNTGVNDTRTKFILDEFVSHGANPDIMVDSTPHIGSDRLQKVVKSFREEIISLGGEVLFQSRLTGITSEKGHVKEAIYLDKDGNEQKIATDYLILAIGHSPFDTVQSLSKCGLKMEPKDFSIGVRIEHPQAEINEALYHSFANNPKLPAASYRVVDHLASGRAVYSFCNCPGGYVFNSSTEEKTVLTNGMSNEDRGAKNGNSALLVNVKVADYYHSSPLDGFLYRGEIERKAYLASHPYFAPAETVNDFLRETAPSKLGKVEPSYEPGTYLANLSSFLPKFMGESLKEALLFFKKRTSFFADMDAVLTGFETRSSSPIRIPRDDSFQSSIQGLYPAGEGASYAGGITSAALDGIKIALALLK
jgi:uncharacterized FAD-dependent dehydrogenase